MEKLPAYFPHRNGGVCCAYAIVVLAAHPAAAARPLTRALPRLPILVLRMLGLLDTHRAVVLQLLLLLLLLLHACCTGATGALGVERFFMCGRRR